MPEAALHSLSRCSFCAKQAPCQRLHAGARFLSGRRQAALPRRTAAGLGWGSQHPAHSRSRQRRVRVQAARDPYEVLGVAKGAGVDAIKKAFKKRALQYHPDVNKAPDAKDRFMECKAAYQALTDGARRGTNPTSEQNSTGGWRWDDPFGRAGTSGRAQQDEPFYGLGDFFRDLDRDVQARRARRGTQPKSLLEELADIGEDFVEFLEQGLGVDDKERDPSLSDAERAARRRRAAEEASTQAAAARTEAQKRAERAAATAQEGARRINDDVEDMLQRMKRDLGL